MPYEILQIGPVPCDEPCAQVGELDYHERSRRECRVFQRMLLRLFPKPEAMPDSKVASVVVLTFPHELGRYREVCLRFAPSNPIAAKWAYRIESSVPVVWDAVAQSELAWLEQQAQLLLSIERGDISASELPPEFRRADIPAF